MKKLMILSAAFCTTFTFAHIASAADDMAGMKMDGIKMDSGATKAAQPTDVALTDAVVKKVDASTGMVTIQHGALTNVGMPAMTMAFKAKNAAMLKQAKEGEQVKVRVESVNGTMTIVKLVPGP
jgi:Cu(I)/Ag(I) efflux system protein CusF